MLIEDRRVIYKTVNDVFKISSVICWEFVVVVVVASSKRMLIFTISVKEVNVFLFQIIFKRERE